MKKRQICVMIVDDHPIVRRGLSDLLASEHDFHLVEPASNGKEALQKFDDADIIVMDVRMPVMDGFETARRILAQKPSAKILLLAGMPLREELARARDMGIGGYFAKSADQEVLVSAIRRLASGESFVSEEFTPVPTMFSQRQQQVLEFLSQGKTKDEIAVILGVTHHTVKTYVEIIHRKLDVYNTTAAVARAYELGILKAF